LAANYGVTGEQTAVEVSPGETILSLFSPGTTHEGEIFYAAVSAGGAMSDLTQRGIFQRNTAQGTEGAGVVPAPFDADKPASILDAGEDHSVEPTYTAATELWEEDVHIRALAQIQLQPTAHWIVPATTNAGIGLVTFSATYAGSAHGTVHFLE
jgi:hypothetical protein